MAVEIEIECEGRLKTRAVHGPSGVALATAAPVDNQGDGSSFSPTDLVATALGTCMMTVMAIAARKHDVDLAGSRVRVTKVMSADLPRRIVGLPATVTVPPGVPAEIRERLEAAARGCPVMRSISHEIEAPVEFTWG